MKIPVLNQLNCTKPHKNIYKTLLAPIKSLILTAFEPAARPWGARRSPPAHRDVTRIAMNSGNKMGAFNILAQ